MRTILHIVWLLIAPTKTDRQMLLDAPFSFGSLQTVADNWQSLVSFQDGLLWTWIGNSAFYCIAALAITLITSVPAGYALALTEFRGRRALLAVTLIVMLVPSTALETMQLGNIAGVTAIAGELGKQPTAH